MTDKTDSKEREAIARAMWSLMREHEDRCDQELEDLEPSHPIWSYADAARASLAANAGREPVASIYITPAGEREMDDWKVKLPPGRNILYTHPSPPEGMVGGWISVKERLPQPFEEVVVYPRPDDYCCEAFCDTAGNWKWAEYEHNFGVHHRGCQVEYWLMLPEVPAPPTTSAGSGKGA